MTTGSTTRDRTTPGSCPTPSTGRRTPASRSSTPPASPSPTTSAPTTASPVQRWQRLRRFPVRADHLPGLRPPAPGRARAPIVDFDGERYDTLAEFVAATGHEDQRPRRESEVQERRGGQLRPHRRFTGHRLGELRGDRPPAGRREGQRRGRTTEHPQHRRRTPDLRRPWRLRVLAQVVVTIEPPGRPAGGAHGSITTRMAPEPGRRRRGTPRPRPRWGSGG